jgi:cytochrome c
MRHITVLAVAAVLGWTLNAWAQDAEALLKKEGCMKCHSVSAKKEGPSFKDISAKYKGKPDGAAAVQKQITAGKDHPHVKTKNEKDVKAIVDYVLSR